MQVKPIDLSDIRAAEIDCECGSLGRLNTDGRGKSVTCAVFSPELTIRVLMKEVELDEPPPRPIDDVLIIKEL